MPQLRVFVVDAFTDRVFSGNPAAVIPLERWLPDLTLQSIAAENNLSETAFFVPQEDGFHIRWMTPTAEVDLCGHATLASSFVILKMLEPSRSSVRFHSKSGPLEVHARDDLLEMDFPSWKAERIVEPPTLERALGLRPREVWAARDLVAVFDHEDQVRKLQPNMMLVAQLDRGHGIICTASGGSSDFVSRFFAPSIGIPEDPVTGSAHCTLTPLWSQKLGKVKLHARQLSKRGGELFCELRGDRVFLAGRAVRYSEGTIFLP